MPNPIDVNCDAAPPAISRSSSMALVTLCSRPAFRALLSGARAPQYGLPRREVPLQFWCHQYQVLHEDKPRCGGERSRNQPFTAPATEPEFTGIDKTHKTK